MKKSIYLAKVDRPNEFVLLDTDLGTFTPGVVAERGAQGNYASIDGQHFGIFSVEGKLYLQWNNRRWDLVSLGSKVKYAHDFRRQRTNFSVEDVAFEYPAWWVGDTTFDPSLPERDEDEDFLAYVASLARNGELQKILIQSWDR